MRYLILLPLLLACSKERVSNPLSNYLYEDYYCYRIEESWPTHPSWQDNYYFDAQGLLDFLSTYGQPSGNIFDFDGSGEVDSGDLLDVQAGFGDVAPVPFDIYSASVNGQFSSGWLLNIEGFDDNFAVLKVTPSDEGGVFIPDTLKSFFIEGTVEGQNFKYWFHAYQ